MSQQVMTQALAGVGKANGTSKPLAPAQGGRILQELGFTGEQLGGNPQLVVA